MSASFFVPFEFPCIRHPDEQVTIINLTPDINPEERVLCPLCQIGNQENCHSIGNIFECLSVIQKKNELLKVDLQNLKQLYVEVFETINHYLKSLNYQIKELEETIESNKTIKDQDLDTYLQRDNEYPTQKLGELMGTLSGKLQLVDGSIKPIQTSYSKANLEFKKKIQKELKELYDFIPDYKLQQQIEFPEKISAIDFNRNGNLLAIANMDITNDFWSIWSIDEFNRLKLCQKLKGHTNFVKSICFGPNDQILTGSLDTKAILWERGKNEKWIVKQVFDEHGMSVNCVRFSNSDKFLATAAKELIIWEKTSINYELSYPQIHEKSIINMCFNKDDSILATADKSNNVLVYIHDSDKWIQSIQFKDSNKTFTYLFFIEQNFYSISQSSEEVYVKKNNNQNHQYDKKVIKNNMENLSVAHCEVQQLQAISGKKVITFSKINPQGLQTIQIIEAPSGIIQFSRDGKRVALGFETKLQMYSNKKKI